MLESSQNLSGEELIRLEISSKRQQVKAIHFFAPACSRRCSTCGGAKDHRNRNAAEWCHTWNWCHREMQRTFTLFFLTASFTPGCLRIFPFGHICHLTYGSCWPEFTNDFTLANIERSSKTHQLIYSLPAKPVKILT